MTITHLYASLFCCTLLVCGFRCSPANNETSQTTVDISKIFSDAGVNGTFVLFDEENNEYLVHNEERAETPFIPASTFKVLNSLIALETGAIPDTTTVFAWDGVERSIPQWNQDHTLPTAISSSVVWFYQELARRIGEDRMQDYVSRSGYGNENIGGAIDMFWLTGDLRISPKAQVDFLRKLHNRSLPFSERAFDIVESILIEDQTDVRILRGKSGWADGELDIGWYIGYVVRDANAYYFALNMDIDDSEQGSLRRGIAKQILTDLGIL